MKALIFAFAVSSMIAAAPVFAADAQSATDPMASPPAMAQAGAVPIDASRQSMSAVEPQAKTRAEVYQELVRAEKSGQMQLLNSTLYAN